MSGATKVPPFETANLLRLLFDRAVPTLTPDELSYIGDHAGQHATWLTKYAADAAEALGSLLDVQRGGVPSSDLAPMFCLLADVLRQAVELQSIGGEAVARRERDARGARDAGAPTAPD